MKRILSLLVCFALLMGYAVWAIPVNAATNYTVSYVDKTGKSYTMPSSQTVASGTTITLPNVTATANGKLGYWSLREDGKYKRFEPGTSYVVKSNTTFYFVKPTIDLTIKASGQNDETFVYQITATNFSLDVCVPAGNTGVTIYDLPSNVNYTVTELTKHSWRYTTASASATNATGTTSITVGVANAASGVVTVNFTHSNRNSKWLTDCKSNTMTYVPSITIKHELADYSKDGKHNIGVYNAGSMVDIYVRVSITTHTFDANGNILANSSWALPTELYVRTGEGHTKTYWVKHGGFYYYTKPLKTNNATNVAAKTHETQRLFISDFSFGTNQNWTVSIQSIEATADAARDLWGVAISEGSVTSA